MRLRLTLDLGDAEAKALRVYAEREGITPREAARKLVTEEMERRAGQERCTHCGGTGWT